MYSSSLQYIPLGNAGQCIIQIGELRIHTISTSTEGLPNWPFMDHHCPCFIRRFGKTVEDVYTRESKITTTAKFSTVEVTSSKLSTLSITGRISEVGQDLYFLKLAHPHSNPTFEERTFFQWHVTFQQMHQEKPLTLIRECPQLAHQNSHDQRCKGHQEKSQPVHQNTDPTIVNIGTCHLNTKCHQICYTSQQTTHQCSHGSGWEDTQWHHHTFQHHNFNIYTHKLPADTPSCLLHSG